MKGKKKQPKGQWGGYREPGTGKRPRGYAGSRDADGLTPRQRLDLRKAELAEIELAVRRGELVSKADVDKAEAEAAEILRNDLGYTLPATLASRLSGRVFHAHEVRTVVQEVVREMVGRWQSAGHVRDAQLTKATDEAQPDSVAG